MTLPTTFLLVSTVVCLHSTPTISGRHGLRCENDFIYTIKCSLSFEPAALCDSCVYWMLFTENMGIYDDVQYDCMLTGVDGNYSCVLDKSLQPPIDEYGNPEIEPFFDADLFEISLCHNTSDNPKSCEVLVKDYMPAKNVTPNAPCCLSVIHNSSKYHFSWKSSFEDSPTIRTMKMLQYELLYFKDPKETGNPLHSDMLNISVADHNFASNTEYTFRVRSSPNQVTLRGQWSKWSSAVHWHTQTARGVPPPKTPPPLLDYWLLVLLCSLAPLLLLLCYVPVVKMRRNMFIPTPAPYFQSLYTDCQGDFKTWVLTESNEVDLLKTEETLQIDVLTKSAAVLEDDGTSAPPPHWTPSDGTSDTAMETTLPGVPYAITPGPPMSALPLLQSESMDTGESGSLGKGDSGCWPYSTMSLEASPLYRNEYCTLSDTLGMFPKPAGIRVEEPHAEVIAHGGYLNQS